MFKKFLCFAVVLILVLIMPISVYASGIPVFQYNQSVSASVSYFQVSYQTYYDERWGSYAAKRYMLYSPSFVGTDYYISSWTGSVTGHSSNSFRNVHFEGSYDGVNWFHVYTVGSWPEGASSTVTINNVNVIPIKQFRLVGNVSHSLINLAVGSFSASITQVGVSMLGADQDTVQAAADAAIQARDAANAANNSLVNGVGNNGKSLSATWDQAAAANNYASWAAGYLDGSRNGGKSLAATYDRAVEARNNIPVIISKVQGQGGATCTTGTSFTAVVSVAPSTNISYSVSCTGPVTPTISVNGNSITFSNLTAAGAYSATITATNTVTGGTATTSFAFFKV